MAPLTPRGEAGGPGLRRRLAAVAVFAAVVIVAALGGSTLSAAGPGLVGAAFAADGSSTSSTGSVPPPILVATSLSNPFTSYAEEILKAEGLSDFASADLGTVTPAYLSLFHVL